MRSKSIILLILSIIIFALPAQAEPSRHKLDNGLTVILSENHEAPVVSVQVLVRAGSAFEKPHEHGITHLIEHMIFKGSPKDPKGEMGGLIEAMGGSVNAYTTFDHTKYYVTVASANAAQALTLLADAVVNASFDEKELKAEKEVVIEEIRMGQDSPGRRRMKAAMRLAFGKDHPYGRPIIGTVESVRALSRQNILDYVARWYRAPSMVVVAVGDFKSKDMLARIKEAFKDASAEPAEHFAIPKPDPGKGPRIEIMREKVQQATMSFSWVIPGLPNQEVFPLDMAASVAGQGVNSRLYQKLKEEMKLVNAAYSGTYTPEGWGLFQSGAMLSPANVQKVWPELVRQTYSLINLPPRAGEMQRARVGLSADFIRTKETMDGQAGDLGYFEMMRGGYEKAADYLQRFRELSAGDVSRAVLKYLTPENLSVVIQLPEGAAVPDRAELAKTVGLVYEQMAKAVMGDDEKAVSLKLGNGLKVIVQPRRAVPLMSYTLIAPGGQSRESAAEAGVFQLWAGALTKGTKQKDFKQLSLELESMAAGISAFGGRTTCGLSGSFLAQDWERGLELMGQVWLTPRFAPDQVAKVKADQLAALRRQKDSPTSRAFVDFNALFYGKNPLGHNSLGSKQTISSVTSQTLRKVHESVSSPKDLVLCVVGDVDARAVIEKVKKLFAGVNGKPGQGMPPMVKYTDKPLTKKILDKNAKQTQIILGYPAPAYKSKDRYAMEVLEAVLGGFGGRLFMDLRDKRSLAYSVQPFFSQTAVSGQFGVYMGVGPGKEKEALDGLSRHLHALRQAPPTDQEMERAKAFLIGGLAIGMQSYGAQAQGMATAELLGLGYDHFRKMPDLLKRVTADEVQKAAQKYLDPKRRVDLTLGQ